MLTIDRKHNNFAHSLNNSVLCCYNCNIRRGNKYHFVSYKHAMHDFLKTGNYKLLNYLTAEYYLNRDEHEFGFY